jgi:hypothetical protein
MPSALETNKEITKLMWNVLCVSMVWNVATAMAAIVSQTHNYLWLYIDMSFGLLVEIIASVWLLIKD